jgi:hypothetical protein
MGRWCRRAFRSARAGAPNRIRAYLYVVPIQDTAPSWLLIMVVALVAGAAAGALITGVVIGALLVGAMAGALGGGVVAALICASRNRVANK